MSPELMALGRTRSDPGGIANSMIAEPDPEVVALCSKLPELTDAVDGIRPLNLADYPPDLLECLIFGP